MPSYTGPRGSGFTSLKQYLELNPEAAQQMGTQLVGDVDARGAAAQGGIAGARDLFSQRAADATAKYQDVDDVAEAQRLADAAVYNGPTALRDVADVDALSASATDATNRARALGTDAGRATLLAEKYGGNGGYTPGAAGLDAFLAGRGAGEQGMTAGSRWGGLRSALGLAETDAAKQGDAARAATADVASRYRSRAGALAQQQSAAQAAQQRANAQQNANARREGIQNSVGNTTTVTPGGTYAGSDNAVTGGRKGPGGEERDWEDQPKNKRRGYP